jgi:hypothetical protein
MYISSLNRMRFLVLSKEDIEQSVITHMHAASTVNHIITIQKYNSILLTKFVLRKFSLYEISYEV